MHFGESLNPSYALFWRGRTGFGSLRLDAGRLHDRPPFLGIGFHQRAERLRRLLLPRENLEPKFGQPRSHRRIRQCLHGRRIELANDVLWRILGRKKPVPAGEGKRCK